MGVSVGVLAGMSVSVSVSVYILLETWKEERPQVFECWYMVVGTRTHMHTHTHAPIYNHMLMHVYSHTAPCAKQSQTHQPLHWRLARP